MKSLLAIILISLAPSPIGHEVMAEELPGPIGLVEIPALFFDPYSPTTAANASDMPVARIEIHALPSRDSAVIEVLDTKGQIHWASLDSEGAAAAFSYGLADGWHRIRMGIDKNINGWIAPDDVGEMRWLGELLQNSLTFATGRWDGRIHRTPEDVVGTVVPDVEPQTDVTVIREVHDDAGRPWYLVLVLSDSGCEEPYPEVRAAGYIPAMVDGESTVWFWAGGC
jgi:hypothetical protein